MKFKAIVGTSAILAVSFAGMSPILADVQDGNFTQTGSGFTYDRNTTTGVLNGVSGMDTRDGLYYFMDDHAKPELYVYNTAGVLVATIKIPGFTSGTLIDWEDLSIVNGKGYIADTGNNGTRIKNGLWVPRQIITFDIPNFNKNGTSQIVNAQNVKTHRVGLMKNGVQTDERSGWSDIEAFAVDPVSNEMYLVTKHDAPQMYHFNGELSTTSVNQFTYQGVIQKPADGKKAMVTGADFSEDGRYFTIVNYTNIPTGKPPYLASQVWDTSSPASAKDEIASVHDVANALSPNSTNVNVPVQPQLEAVSFSPDGKHIISASEYANTAWVSNNPIYTDGPVNPPPATNVAVQSDTYTSPYSPANNYLSSTVLKASNTAYRSYLKFNTAGVGTVTSAKLKVFVDNNDVTVGAVNVKNVADFDATSLTHNNAGSLFDNGTVAGTGSTGPVEGVWTEVDLDPAAIANGVTRLGVSYTGSGSNFQFGSSESANAPVLVLTTSVAPPAATTMVVDITNDTVLSSAAPNTTAGSATTLKATKDAFRSYLRFWTGATTAPAGKNLTGAKLRLFVEKNEVSTGGMVINEIGSFSPSSATWNNSINLFDSATNTHTSTVTPVAGQWVEFGIPVSMVSLGAGASTKLGLAYSDWSSQLEFASQENTAFAPKLVLEFS